MSALIYHSTPYSMEYNHQISEVKSESESSVKKDPLDISVSGNQCQMGLSSKEKNFEESDEMLVDFEAVTDQIKKEIKVENVKSEDFLEK